MTAQYPIIKDASFRNLSFAYNEIMANYLTGAKSKSLVDGAAQGMVASLDDPYSVYLSGEQGEQYMESYQDHFVGIGIEIRQQDGDFIIQDTIEGSPAAKSDLKADDVIQAVDGKPVKGITLTELKNRIQGKAGTVVKLTVLREGTAEPQQIPVTRGEVPVITVTSEMMANRIGEITITRFAEKTADEFNRAIESLQKQGMKALLIDLRGNPGGLLDPTIQLANRFVPKGQVIVQVVYKDEKSVITHKSEQQTPWKLPIAVLVDDNTASSAEVLTAALKERAHATVVGQKTFGKGIVQNFRQLKDGSVLKLTEAQWRAPDGEWIHKKGIEPNVPVQAPAYALLPSLPVGLQLKENDYGDKVKTVQTMLQTLGYSAPSTGIFDAATDAAVRAFQRDESLPATGIVNDRTAYQFSVRLLDKFKKEDPQRNKALELLEAAETAGAAGS